jgi:asparagine synthase (glutamine-hydrolysing)
LSAALAGWVDFERDLAREPELVRDCLGLDTAEPGRAWVRRRAALGGPALAAAPDGSVALAFAGRLQDRRELRSALEEAGPAVPADDAHLALAAYRRWGAGFPCRLRGWYAVAVWDDAGQELLLVRDRLGVEPLLFAPTPHGGLFATSARPMLAHPDCGAAVDEHGLRELVAFAKTPGATVWRGVREVVPGTTVAIDRGGWRSRTYWALEPRRHSDDLPGTIDHLRRAFRQVVDQQLDPGEAAGVMLSGGIDSSVVAAVASQRAAAEPGCRLRSYSVDYAGYEERFVPDQLRGSPDGPYARAAAAHLGLDHTDVVLDAPLVLDAGARESVLAAFDHPTLFGAMNTSLYQMLRRIGSDCRVALSGEGADHLFTAAPPEPVAGERFETLPWLAGPVGAGTLAIFQPHVEAALSLAEFYRQSYRRAAAEVRYLDEDDALERRQRLNAHLYLTRFAPLFTDRMERLGRAAGVPVRSPFLDHRVAEYVFNVPWALKSCDQRDKALLRRAYADVLPAAVVDRRKSAYPSPQDGAYVAGVRAEYAALVGGAGARVFDLLDPARLRGLPARFAPRRATEFECQLYEFVLGLERWLTRYRPRLAL